MCDVREYNDIYNRINKLTQKDITQLIIESDNKDEQDFYGVVGDYLLQRKQREVIERKLF